jgi:hypothetical protein
VFWEVWDVLISLESHSWTVIGIARSVWLTTWWRMLAVLLHFQESISMSMRVRVLKTGAMPRHTIYAQR